MSPPSAGFFTPAAESYSFTLDIDYSLRNTDSVEQRTEQQMQVTGVSKEVAATVPNIGQVWPGQGGVYAGVCRGRDGQPDHYLVLADAKPASELSWNDALAWAKTVEVDGHTDFAVPDRFQSSVLFGNVGELFERDWHWTSTQCSAQGAWGQGFYGGSQNYGDKSYEGLARAVRRLAINPSVLQTVAA